MFNWLKRLLFGEKRALPSRPDKPPATPDLDFQQQRTAHHHALDPADLPALACPACGAAVGAVDGHYLVVALADDGDTISETFLIGGDFVYYCPACPTALVDTAELNEYMRPLGDVSGDVYVIAYADLDAVPESQHHLPLEEVDLPLIPFLTDGFQPPASSRRSTRKRKRRKKRRRRR